MNVRDLKKTARLLAAGILMATMPFSPNQVFASSLQTHYVSVDMTNATLKELFEMIEQKFDYSFLIRNNDIDLNERITVDTKDKSVEEILKNALKNQNAEFVVNDNRIIVYKSATKPAEKSVEKQIVQQTTKVSGTVVDAVTGEPVIGANVVVKGTTNGTSTDFDGNFSFEAPAGSILVVSYIGYNSLEVAATNTPMTIRIKEDSQALSEVVIVGYGVQKRESLTGALQTLNNEKLTNITTPSVQNMIAGKSPGVMVAPGDGRPGSEGSIIIRGKASVNGNNDPLWVVDGVIVGYRANQALNPNDIETMTILKDAASTAIYGAQGSNGVILVTTKKGRTDKMNISASVKLGVNTLTTGKMQVMNGAELYDQFAAFTNQEEVVFPRWNQELRNTNFDWWDFATQTGFTQDYNISIAGGTEKLRSFLSLNLYDEEGAVKGYDFKRYNFRFNAEYKPYDWLSIKPSMSGSRREIMNKEYSVTAMYSNLPWDSPYDEDGNIVPHKSSLWVNSNSTNYLYDLQWNNSQSLTHTFMGNFDFDVRITDWLTFSSINSYSFNEYDYKNYTDPRSNAGSGVDGRMEEQRQETIRRYTNQLLRFNKSFDKHSVNGVLGYEFNDYKFQYLQAIGTGFVPGFEVLNVAAIPEKTAGYIYENAVQSYIFNVNYSYDNKYLAQFSFRRDGSSKLGKDVRYGNLFSISGGWNIHRESFMEYDWLDQLKLRASYGSTGNLPGKDYPQYDLYAANAKYKGVPGTLIYQIGNKDLTWEKTYTLGIGLDIAVFDRVRATIDYYNRYTSNVLFEVPIASVTGVDKRVWQNIGEVENKGFEFTIGADILKNKDFYWGVDFNIGVNRNKVKKLYGEANQNGIVEQGFGGPAGSVDRLIKIGEDIDTFYGYEWAGVNPENGAPQWYKTAEDGVTREITSKYADADRVILGTLNPDFFGGFSTDFAWKKFDLNAVFSYSVGGQLYNYARQEYDSDGAYVDRNQMKLKKGWSRWEKPGDIATHPVASYNNKSESQKMSSRYLEDGDFLKLRSLSLGYNFDLTQWSISNLRLFFTAENLFTITEYSGVDPELPVKSSDNAVVNVAGPAVYPTTRKFMFGINITL
ncbi:TonB-linked SusC/RagA family outer membrane protein [Parabacteroides sp. PF5-5]|uniref:TonB-dependent receptor n=1 Tax=unclassified Parabacteroides TaxID=2649774 RepID=UPI00247559EE|nr:MULTISPECIES: TonB-dependent receptor [unclassified Parabacteroides]MDH6303940.1 TonB-linked SusC/RagA family outer membrane protein [Parabacteroides sp. PH5-39]MDH6314557.1 TonB-linked SusC/RagA family outer membrane protein [Parabacteroides sp. PF5-13]MDH6318378.1 TonB-linked SusC/RagA family outer membrane protein [Parabacteroides sp. PH5-13]MDH6322329.1 TonB-linked SusC/RagA family outer membrane protein [Parabacteroides sp. PH5-8]MDH6325591.1 TonB-linked SusC/RagA family outer membrane